MQLITATAYDSPARTAPSDRAPLTVGLVQTRWHADPSEHRAVLADGIRTAAAAGAELVFLSELTLSRYPADTKPDAAPGGGAEPLMSGPTFTFAARMAAETGAVVHASLYERAEHEDGRGLNTAILVSPSGELLARTRKLHIPITAGYYEDHYFRPGPAADAYPVTALPAPSAARVGLPTCWDEWFPEVARSYALAGAEVLAYPTAIGSEPDHPDFDTEPLWRQVIVGHGIANGTFMVVPNRWGDEGLISFYGSSFISDPYGRILARAPRDADATLVATLDLAQRGDWLTLFPFLRTRRPDTYAALTAPIHQEDPPMTNPSELECDVVVIGAGVTGLTVAGDLQRDGFSVHVVEARERVGGRLRTETIDGARLELGGQWVSPDQEALLATLAELGLPTYPRYRAGESVYVDAAGTATRFTGELFPTGEHTQREIERLIAEFDALSAHIDPAAPWSHPRAAELDAQSLSAWLEERSDDAEARANVALYLAEAMLTKPAHSFSVLQGLLMAASAGGFEHLVDADFILDRRVVGGLQQVPLRLAERLGDRVHLGVVARRLDWSDDGVVLHADGLRVRARRAVVAVPPNLYSRIEYSPALPPVRQQMHQHLSLGLVIKVHAVYPTPFWRDAGLSGTAFSPYQVVHESYDNTGAEEDGTEESTGTLVGFVAAETADALLALPAPERRARILDSLAAYYGDEARNPIVYFESDWVSEEWTGGAYAASFDLGGLSRWGAQLRSPLGPIRFASSDLAAEGYQHVDGGIRIGHDVAAELAASLLASAQGTPTA